MEKQNEKTIIEDLLNQKWIFAKTMPETPHWYTLRKNWADNKSFDEAVILIREKGYRKKHRGRTYIYLEIENMKYWTMGAPVNKTILINRALI